MVFDVSKTSVPQASEAKRPTATILDQSTDADSLPQLFLYVRYAQCDEMKRSFVNKAVQMMNTNVL